MSSPVSRVARIPSSPPLRRATESSPMRIGDGHWLVAEVPVYRRSPEAYLRELDRRPRRYVLRPSARAGPDESRVVGWWWDYNELAGWIELFVVPGGTVKGYLWRKRIAKTPNRGKTIFVPEGSGMHDLECVFVGGESSPEIYARLREELVEFVEQEFRTGAYLDLEAFDTTGPAVNWRALLGIAHGPRSATTNG